MAIVYQALHLLPVSQSKKSAFLQSYKCSRNINLIELDQLGKTWPLRLGSNL